MANTRSNAYIRVGIALFLLVAGLLIGILVPQLGATDEPIARKVHIVQRGETLWGLAGEYSHGDPRRFVHQTRVLNDLESASIFPGQQLILPTG